MNKQQYLKARQLIRENGLFAVRWLAMSQASIMLRLANQRRDELAEKAAMLEDWKDDQRVLAYAHAYNL